MESWSSEVRQYTEEGAGEAEPQEFTAEYTASRSRFCSFFSEDFSLKREKSVIAVVYVLF